jgi:acyl-CoA reductase-like NAD-dependent aldehyde dehydrogenase
VLNVVFGTGPRRASRRGFAIDKGLIQKISFTGSTAVGIARSARSPGRNLQIRRSNSAARTRMIVMDDADIDLAVTAAIWAAYGTGGQRCTSLGNLILHKNIADKFVKKFVEQGQAS